MAEVIKYILFHCLMAAVIFILMFSNFVIYLILCLIYMEHINLPIHLPGVLFWIWGKYGRSPFDFSVIG